MLEKAFSGGSRYWTWLAILGLVIANGVFFYLRQFNQGLAITGMSRDVVWGLYIAQFTFFVGVAASAVMVVLPYYLHNFKAFGRITILGEYVAIASVGMCVLFIFVDMGMPFRIVNVFLHPTLHSMMFWDTVVLSGYALLNLVISHFALNAERNGEAPPRWLRPIIILSIPWAVSIHTVTAFLYSGLAARPFWMTAILAPRFLASAFSAGPALLILFALLLRKLTKFDPGKEAIDKLSIIVTYAMSVNVFFVLMELFTALYSDIPEHLNHFKVMYLGLGGESTLVPFMWISAVLAVVSLVLLLNPATRKKESTLVLACIAVFVALWLEKGLGMIIAGFIPSTLGKVVHYAPTFPELSITVAVWAVGAVIITALYKVALSVRRELKA